MYNILLSNIYYNKYVGVMLKRNGVAKNIGLRLFIIYITYYFIIPII